MNEIQIMSYLVLWFIVVVEGACLVALMRLLGDMHLHLTQLSQGSGSDRRIASGKQLNDSRYRSLDGQEFSLSELWSSRRLCLFLVTPTCVPCRDTLKAFASLYFDVVEKGWQGCVLCFGAPRLAQYLVEDAGLPPGIPVATTVQEDFEQRGIVSTPTIVIVDAGGRVRNVVMGPKDGDALRNLLLGDTQLVAASMG